MRMIAEDSPVAWRQWTVLALVLAALVIDGIDTQLLALVAPLIMAEWGVDKASFGPAMSAALFGMALGAGSGGWLGDRLGRRSVLVGATLLFGLCTFGVGLTHSLVPLIALRLASGLGFGALAPNGAALVSEWLPVRVRPRAMGLLSITIPMGGLIGGSAVLALLPVLGWRGCFMACGIGTLAMAGAILLLLPESPAFLAARGRHDEADRLFARVTGAAAGTKATTANAAPASVFSRANLRLNTGGWLAFFCLQLIAYGFLSWAPVFLTMIGWPLEHAIRGTLVFNLSAVCASLMAGWLLGWVRVGTLALSGAVGAILALLALYALTAATPQPPTPAHEWATLGAVAVVSILAGWGIAAIYTLLSFAYPAGCRAGGMGFGLMAGRTGGITIALSGGMLLAIDGDSLLPFFAVLTVAASIAAVGILILGRRYTGRLGDMTDG
jgi:AAHS family 4-hydroxybenzoate transporter-like MFS transporter